MKYNGKEYEWFEIMFENGKPEGVKLYKNCPWKHFRVEDGMVFTYWDNEKLTEKPKIKQFYET